MIQFQDRAVAFIDVLGFKSLVNNAVADSKSRDALDILVGILGAVVPYLDSGVAKTMPQDLIPKHLYVSDCVVLSAPLSTPNIAYANYSGLEILVMRVIQITQLLFDFGYLVRGGIAIGPLWQIDSNVVGPAYQEALGLEKVAGTPRVILSERAETLWRSVSQRQGNLMCIDYEGKLMVNGLHTFYIPPKYGLDISAAHSRFTAVILENLNAGHAASVAEKWEWMQRYLRHSQK
jgi:hypothetical protein